jgi:hypothetical protein
VHGLLHSRCFPHRGAPVNVAAPGRGYHSLTVSTQG